MQDAIWSALRDYTTNQSCTTTDGNLTLSNSTLSSFGAMGEDEMRQRICVNTLSTIDDSEEEENGSE